MRLLRAVVPALLPLLAAPSLLAPLMAPLMAQDAAVAESSKQGDPLPAGMAEKIVAEGIEHSHAMRLLRDLCANGHRLTGSDNFTKACEWGLAEFEKMGLAAHLEQWAEWKLVWNRGAWIGRVVHPIQLDMYVATEAWTAGTKGMQKGLVMMVPDSVDQVDADEVRGKWLFHGRRRPSAEVREACEKAGILGWVYRAGDPTPQFPTRVRVFGDYRTAMKSIDDVPTVPSIAVRADDADQLLELIDQASRGGGEAPICEFDIQNSFREGPIKLHNVIAEIPGTEKPDEVVIVCGHLDSWHQAQGTTDNGTGATSTLEAARILAAVGAKPKRTLRFCLWGGEEEGLLGSHGHVQRFRADMDKVSAVFNHDTGTNWAQTLSVTRKMAEQLEPVFAHVNRLMKAPDEDFDGEVFDLRITQSVRGGGGSDHASFIAAGVPAWSWGLKGRSDYFQYTWHTQWDTIDVAIEEYQRHTATVIAIAALGTANLDQLLDREGVSAGGGGRGQSSAFAEGWFGASLDGMKFKDVKADGRAAKLGVMDGDVLIEVGGQKVENLRQIFQFAREVEGENVEFVFRRGDQTFKGALPKSDVQFRRGG
ncbi:MAG: M20/M25/M40 family metallo-hydrolase [Planctomycetes bacterium]|nr:M20/M25/M40 family metallo-hydrolase [Planctomycetota bacterium]